MRARSVTGGRWRRVLPLGVGGVACLACCTVPLWLAGGLTVGGGALALDACMDSWLPAIVIAGPAAGAAALGVRWVRRRRARDRGPACP